MYCSSCIQAHPRLQPVRIPPRMAPLPSHRRHARCLPVTNAVPSHAMHLADRSQPAVLPLPLHALQMWASARMGTRNQANRGSAMQHEPPPFHPQVQSLGCTCTELSEELSWRRGRGTYRQGSCTSVTNRPPSQAGQQADVRPCHAGNSPVPAQRRQVCCLRGR